MSATFNEDVQALKELVLHNPVRGTMEGSGAAGMGALKDLDAPPWGSLWWDSCHLVSRPWS